MGIMLNILAFSHGQIRRGGMRNSRIILSLIQSLAILLIGATAGYAQSPKDAVRNHWEAMIRGDYGAAWEAACEKHKKIISKDDYVARYSRGAKNNPNKFVGIEIGRVDLRGDNATVHYILANKTRSGVHKNKGTSQVINENGRWGVLLPESLVKEAGKPKKNDPRILANATSCSIVVILRNWRRGPENDGIAIHPSLNDSKGNRINFEKIKVPVDVKIYTADNREVLSKSSSIDDRRDALPVFWGGIKIPFEDMDTRDSDDDFGSVHITVTLPDGRTLEAKKENVRIKPESE